jgi:hypothetical protein
MLKFREKPELVDDFKGRGVKGVAPEIAVEVLLRFKQKRFDSISGKEVSEENASGPASDDTTGDGLNGRSGGFWHPFVASGLRRRCPADFRAKWNFDPKGRFSDPEHCQGRIWKF